MRLINVQFDLHVSASLNVCTCVSVDSENWDSCNKVNFAV